MLGASQDLGLFAFCNCCSNFLFSNKALYEGFMLLKPPLLTSETKYNFHIYIYRKQTASTL